MSLFLVQALCFTVLGAHGQPPRGRLMKPEALVPGGFGEYSPGFGEETGGFTGEVQGFKDEGEGKGFDEDQGFREDVGFQSSEEAGFTSPDEAGFKSSDEANFKSPEGAGFLGPAVNESAFEDESIPPEETLDDESVPPDPRNATYDTNQGPPSEPDFGPKGPPARLRRQRSPSSVGYLRTRRYAATPKKLRKHFRQNHLRISSMRYSSRYRYHSVKSYDATSFKVPLGRRAIASNERTVDYR